MGSLELSNDHIAGETGMEVQDHVAAAGGEHNTIITGSSAAGGWRAIKYILGNEAFEKLASMSLVGNMTVYLRTKYNLEGVELVNVVSIWNGTSNISTLAGAFVSDAYFGRFLTLFCGSLSSLTGMGIVTLTAGVSKLRPPPCKDEDDHSHACVQPHGWQLAVLYAGLALLSLGSGCIRPCNIAFGADQFDTDTAKGRSQLESFINWWYFSFTIALLLALTAVIYIQTEISWTIGFAIPTACLLCSISIFLIGRHTYINKPPQGSVFVDLAKVVTASFLKRRVWLGQPSLTLSEEESHSYYDPPPRAAEMTTKLPPTGRFLFLNKAAVIMDGELDEDGNPRNTWRLCSVQQVEQLKCLIGIIPVWVSGLGCFLVMDQQASFGTLQAIQMNRSVLFGSTHFKVPPAWMGITSMIALSIWILVYERVYVVTFKKISGRTGDDDHACRLTPSQRIRAGIFMSILCMLSAAVVEQKRRASALKHHTFESPLSFALLLPQFVLSGLTEALAAVAIMEFFTTEIPENMRSLAGSVFFLSLSFASYLSSILVNVIHSATKRKGRSPWLGGHDLNKNRLEYYYYIIAAIAGLNFLYYNLVASSFVTSSSKEDVTESRAMENSRSRLMTELEQRGDINGSEEIELQRIAAAV